MKRIAAGLLVMIMALGLTRPATAEAIEPYRAPNGMWVYPIEVQIDSVVRLNNSHRNNAYTAYGVIDWSERIGLFQFERNEEGEKQAAQYWKDCATIDAGYYVRTGLTDKNNHIVIDDDKKVLEYSGSSAIYPEYQGSNVIDIAAGVHIEKMIVGYCKDMVINLGKNARIDMLYFDDEYTTATINASSGAKAEVYCILSTDKITIKGSGKKNIKTHILETKKTYDETRDFMAYRYQESMYTVAKTETKTRTLSNGTVYNETYKYDKAGHLLQYTRKHVKCKNHDSTDWMGHSPMTWYYDTAGNIRKYVLWEEDGKTVRASIYYDEDGYPFRETTYTY